MKKRNKRILLALSLLVMSVLIIYNLPERKDRFYSRHFKFLFSHGIDSLKIKELSIKLEESYSRVSNDLKTMPTDTIEVNVYSARWRYGKATGNWGASGNIEGTSKLHFVEFAWDENDSKKVAVHEFTHAVVLKMLIEQEKQPFNAAMFDERFATFPVWLWEAISCYEAGQVENLEGEPFMENGRYPELNELNNRSKGGKIYKVGYSLIDFILQNFGREKLLELIANYGNLKRVMNQTNEQFSKGWYTFIKTKYN